MKQFTIVQNLTKWKKALKQWISGRQCTPKSSDEKIHQVLATEVFSTSSKQLFRQGRKWYQRPKPIPHQTPIKIKHIFIIEPSKTKADKIIYKNYVALYCYENELATKKKLINQLLNKKYQIDITAEIYVCEVKR